MCVEMKGVSFTFASFELFDVAGFKTGCCGLSFCVECNSLELGILKEA